MLTNAHTDMKKNILKTGIFAVLGILALASCADEPYKYEMTSGLPEIYYIRPAGAARDTLLTSAYMGNGLCVVGNNLRSTYKVFFNDQEAILNSSYITDNTLLLSVPNTIPEEVSDKIFFYNKEGEATEVDFKVLVPGPVVSAMGCEWQPAGTQTTITGDYFIDDPNVPLTVTFAGGVTAQVKNITKNIITIEVPDGAQEGPVTVSTIYGQSSSAFHYMDSRGMLFDFDSDPRRVCHGWHNGLFIGSDETSLSGNYLRLGAPDVTMSATGGWDDGNFSFEYWPGDWSQPLSYNNGPLLTDFADFSDWENMSLKFEMNIPSANGWAAGMMQFIVGGVDKVSYSDAGTDIFGNTVAGANNSYFNNNDLPRGIYQPWTTAADGIYSTEDQWMTVTVPYSSFIYGFDGTQASGRLKASDFTSLTIFVVGGPEGKECNPVIKIDNIRAVPNK